MLSGFYLLRGRSGKYGLLTIRRLQRTFPSHGKLRIVCKYIYITTGLTGIKIFSITYNISYAAERENKLKWQQMGNKRERKTAGNKQSLDWQCGGKKLPFGELYWVSAKSLYNARAKRNEPPFTHKQTVRLSTGLGTRNL
jgi:hypothetical protein